MPCGLHSPVFARVHSAYFTAKLSAGDVPTATLSWSESVCTNILLSILRSRRGTRRQPAMPARLRTFFSRSKTRRLRLFSRSCALVLRLPRKSEGTPPPVVGPDFGRGEQTGFDGKETISRRIKEEEKRKKKEQSWSFRISSSSTCARKKKEKRINQLDKDETLKRDLLSKGIDPSEKTEVVRLNIENCTPNDEHASLTHRVRQS